MASLAPALGEFDDLVDVQAGCPARLDREPQDLEPVEGAGLRRHADGGRVDAGPGFLGGRRGFGLLDQLVGP